MVQENSSGGDLWDDVFGDESSKKKPAVGEKKSGSFFLRLSVREEPFRIRPVVKPVMFFKHFVAFKFNPDKSLRYPISPAFSFEEKSKDIAWSTGNYNPSLRYAMVVIDREDGKIKVLEAGPSIFNKFRDYIKMTKSDPTSKESGIDWLIRVSKGAKKDDPNSVDYSCMPDPTGPKPLTAEEDKELQSFISNMEKYTKEKYDSSLGWRYFFRPLSSEKIKEMWLALPEDKRVRKVPQKGEKSQPPKSAEKPVEKKPEPTPEPKAEEPAEGGDDSASFF